jgi:signal transduction histidine kinase
MEWDELFLTVFVIFIGAAFVLLLANYLINKNINHKIWHPFFNTMGIIREFSLKNNTVPHFQSSDIDEFNELNTTLKELIDRIRDDYNSLREFTENASHETQTPLSVIHAGLDTLSQHPALDEDMAKNIEDTRVAANRLSKLNRNLLLLTKMENKQFNIDDIVDIVSLLRKQQDELNSLFLSKDIAVETDLPENYNVQGNKALSEILITNLLSNMIRYTPENGRSTIHLRDDKLIFSNSGSPLIFPEEKLFDRFTKGDNQGSNGLGLAIAKQITVTQKWKLLYNYQEGNHNFVIDFRS